MLCIIFPLGKGLAINHPGDIPSHLNTVPDEIFQQLGEFLSNATERLLPQQRH